MTKEERRRLMPESSEILEAYYREFQLAAFEARENGYEIKWEKDMEKEGK